ncbi:hypothetical protein RJ55_05485 [Drechmeria coniospora]|nr:hypothetical protein RJ55_05485 [Drechmeria coniospora]
MQDAIPILTPLRPWSEVKATEVVIMLMRTQDAISVRGQHTGKGVIAGAGAAGGVKRLWIGMRREAY